MNYKRSLILAVFTLSFFAFNYVFAESTDMRYVAQTTDQLNQTHVRYNQFYQGVPVFGSQMIAHLNPDLSVRTTSGKILPNLSLNTQPAVTQEKAISRAKGYWQQEYNISEVDKESATLYIFNPSLFTGKNSDNKTSLVWQVELFKDRPAYHKFYFLDAQTNELIFQIDGIQTAVHRHIRDCSYADGYCYYGEEQGAYDFINNYYVGRSEGYGAIGSNPYWWVTRKTETDDLYDLFGDTHSYYETKFSRNGANNSGGIGDGSTDALGINYPVNSTTGFTYIDFYWFSPDEEYNMCPNAFFNGTNSIHFCEGEISDDLVGHEYGHAVNYFSILSDSGAAAGLTYSGESGALNEANSDVFGEALEYYNDGSSDWQHGEETPSGASRSMSDPSSITYNLGAGAVPYPESYNDSNFYCGSEDGGGVHINSSVGNYAAYLMSEGGTVKGCIITGIGEDKEERIFYRAQTVYYTPSTTFNQAYTALIQSCNDLYGAGSSDCINVIKALRAVEMNGTGTCNGGTLAADLTSACAAVDTGPTISSISSEVVDGYYKAGTTIDIDVTFSEAVTSTGDVTITLETGDTDRTCAFTVASATTATCNYTVQAGDNSADLEAIISGTITNSDGAAITSFTPITSLATNKNIVVDTEKPKIPKYIKVYASKNKNRRIKTINTDNSLKTIIDVSEHPYFTWKKATDSLSGIKNYFVRFSEKKLTRTSVKKTKYKRTSRFLKTEIWNFSKTYRLYMIVQDRAGNTSKLKTLLKYQVTQ